MTSLSPSRGELDGPFGLGEALPSPGRTANPPLRHAQRPPLPTFAATERLVASGRRSTSSSLHGERMKVPPKEIDRMCGFERPARSDLRRPGPPRPAQRSPAPGSDLQKTKKKKKKKQKGIKSFHPGHPSGRCWPGRRGRAGLLPHNRVAKAAGAPSDPESISSAAPAPPWAPSIRRRHRPANGTTPSLLQRPPPRPSSARNRSTTPRRLAACSRSFSGPAGGAAHFPARISPDLPDRDLLLRSYFCISAAFSHGQRRWCTGKGPCLWRALRASPAIPPASCPPVHRAGEVLGRWAASVNNFPPTDVDGGGAAGARINPASKSHDKALTSRSRHRRARPPVLANCCACRRLEVARPSSQQP